MIPRFTEFYVPVLKVLEDTNEHEINKLIEEVADYCKISEADRQEMTRSGSYPRYHSNIQWAITDLYQGAFINRTSRGVYKINFDGLLLLEENPEHPTREYLVQKSAKFLDFITRKREKTVLLMPDEGLFAYHDNDEEEEHTEAEDTKSDMDLLEEYKKHREEAKRLNLNTSEIDARIKEIEEKVYLNRIKPLVENIIADLSYVSDIKCGLYIDLFNDKPKAFLTFDPTSRNGIIDPTEVKIENEEEKKMKVAADGVSSDNSTNKRSSSQPIKVYFDNGVSFDSDKASNVFAQAIDYMGAAKVSALGIIVNRMNLVGKKKPKKYNYQQISNGYFVTTNLPNWRKKKILNEVANKLGYKVTVKYSDDEE